MRTAILRTSALKTCTLKASTSKNRTWKARLRLALVALCSGVLAACPWGGEPSVSGVRNEVVVATRNAPTTYYFDRDDQAAGFEYDLALAFAEANGWNLRLVVKHEIGEILEAVASGEVDFAAAGLSKTAERQDDFLVGPTYQTVEERVVCGPGARVKEVADLQQAKLRIIGDSSYQETLQTLKTELPGLRWRTTNALSNEQLLERVSEGELQCTVADSTILALGRRTLPRLKSPFAIGSGVELGWFIAPQAEDLAPLMETWFSEMAESQRLDALLNKYYSAENPFSSYDVQVFRERVDSRLPRYEPTFRRAEEETGLDWTLLAAVGYQESQWQPEAVSPTGVVGLMMLTKAAASDLQIEDRSDPDASILGGARYLRRQLGGIPRFIRGEDRLRMGLASYNVGLGHLQDARRLAVELGHNPNTWPGVESVLPLLSQPRYYQELRYGYARGGEPVIYVKRVRSFHRLLQEIVAQRPPEPEVPEDAESERTETTGDENPGVKATIEETVSKVVPPEVSASAESAPDDPNPVNSTDAE